MTDLILTAVLSMVALAVFFAVVLAFADKKLKVEEDPRIEKVFGLLPHVNCGACGYLSCHDFAEHIITKNEDPLKCRVLGEEAKEKLLNFLGKEDRESFSSIPLIRCSAKTANKPAIADYHGVQTCRAASFVFSGIFKYFYHLNKLKTKLSYKHNGTLKINRHVQFRIQKPGKNYFREREYFQAG